MSIGISKNHIKNPWQLPDGWNWVHLAKVVNIHDGPRKPVKKNARVPGSNPYCGANGIIDSVSGFTHEGSFILLAEDGGSYGKGQASAYSMNGKFWANNHVHILQGKPDLLSNEWLKYALIFQDLTSYCTGATRPKLTQEKMREISIPVPFPQNPPLSLDIQNRIVTRIEALMADIKASRTLVDSMRQKAASVLSTAFEDILTTNADFEFVPLKAVATAFNGLASGEGDSSVRVFKTKHVYPHNLRMDRPSFMKVEQAEKLPLNRYLQSDDVLMANIAEGTLGRVTFVDTCEKNWTVDTQVMILRSLHKESLEGKWLYYYLWSSRGQKEILAKRSGIPFAEKRGQTHIYSKEVLEIPIPIPVKKSNRLIQYQRQLIAYLDGLRVDVDVLQNIIVRDTHLLNEIEQTILEKALKGDL